MNIIRKNVNFLYKKGLIENINFNLKKFIKKSIKKKKNISIKKIFAISDHTGLSIRSLVFKNISKYYEPNNKIKFIVSDIDGVLTNGGMYFTAKGDEIKRYNSKDGLGIQKLKSAGKKIGFLSSGLTNKIVEHRAKMLNVDYVYVGPEKKLTVLENWCKQMNISLKNVAYIGDDLNDLEVITKVGLSACPANSVALVKERANIVLKNNGGEGCFREFVDNWILFQ